MPVNYNPEVMEKSSQHMYWSADITALVWPAIGVLLGGSIGYGIAKTVGALAGGAAGGYIGLQYGESKATALRGQAQTALCLAEIEKNTRKAEQ